MKNEKYKYLYDINSPEDLRKIPVSELPVVCDEVRDFMIDTITSTGGHFGAGLGVVELTVALHYVYNTPEDKIVLDTGHQGYPHKIITGRRDLLHTIRKKGGISGFLKRTESVYDAFGAGHASTSISAALGLASARDLLKKDYRVAAVIGDGAMTGGLAFEAMNNCGVQKRDITVILNDNNMSINANVSAFSNYFNEIFANPKMTKMRENIWELTGRMDEFGDRIRRMASRIEGSVKAIVTPGSLFEAMGFNYYGPINGHNVRQLVKMLQHLKNIHGPVLLHIITQKGKGFAPAEADEHHLHAIGKIDRNTGRSLIAPPEVPQPPTYTKVFGEAMLELCRENDKVVGITAAMADGTGLDLLEKEMPGKFFDVGIAEGHGVTFAAGMAGEGIIPVCAIYSSFLQRAYDHIYHDCALQKLHVVFAIDRAGLVGEDGQTHHGTLDLAYLRTIPYMVVMAPKDEQELRDMLFSAVNLYRQGPIAIRYPRGKSVGVQIQAMQPIPFGKWEMLESGSDVAVLAVGKMVHNASIAARELALRGIYVELVNARFIKPLDTDMLDNVFSRFSKVITIEEGIVNGGFGSGVVEYAASKGYKNDIFIHGLPDKMIEHGTQDELLHGLGLDPAGIASYIESVYYEEAYRKPAEITEKNLMDI